MRLEMRLSPSSPSPSPPPRRCGTPSGPIPPPPPLGEENEDDLAASDAAAFSRSSCSLIGQEVHAADCYGVKRFRTDEPPKMAFNTHCRLENNRLELSTNGCCWQHELAAKLLCMCRRTCMHNRFRDDDFSQAGSTNSVKRGSTNSVTIKRSVGHPVSSVGILESNICDSASTPAGGKSGDKK